MKAVIVTSDGLEHTYVANKLIDAINNNLAGIMVEKKQPRGMSLKTIKTLRKKYSYFRICERIITKIFRKMLRYNDKETDSLFRVVGNSKLKSPENVDILYSKSVNNRESMNWIKKIGPDYLFIYGTGVVKDKVLSLARVGALNMHTGISPIYRGSDTPFWSLYNREPEMVGITVHECVPEIDGGDIYAVKSVELDECDDPFLAFAKCVRDGGDVYAQVASSLLNGNSVDKKAQVLADGRQYRFIDRTFLHDIKMEYYVRSGRLRKIIGKSPGGKNDA